MFNSSNEKDVLQDEAGAKDHNEITKSNVQGVSEYSLSKSRIYNDANRSRSLSPFEVSSDVDIANSKSTIDAENDQQQTNNEQQDLIQATDRNPTAVMELDMDCNVRFLSKSWEIVVGTKIKKILNKPISDIVIADSELDKIIFTRAIEIMSADDLSYRVKFITPTNDTTAASISQEEEKDDEDGTDSDEEVKSGKSAGSESINSGISTDGGFIEMEGQGILIHDLKTQLPTHSMWILRPFVPIEVTLELPAALIEKLGSGVDILESFLISLNESGIIDMDAVPAPKHVLCRICEQQVPAWWLERHAEICLVEHRIEDKVRACHEALIEHKKVLVSLMEGLAHNTPVSPNLQMATLSSPLISPSTSTSTISSTSSASSSSSHHSRIKSALAYKGLALPLPKPIASSAPVTSSPLSSGASSTVSTPVSARKRSSSILGSMRFPLKNLEKLIQYCSEAISINPGEIRHKNGQKYMDVAYSPNSETAIKYILTTTLQDSADPAIHLITEDTEALAREKVDAIERLATSLQYSEKLKNEIDQLVLKAVAGTVEKIREKTTSFDDFKEQSRIETDDIFTNAYMDSDQLPATPAGETRKSVSSPLSQVDSSGESSTRSATPKIQIENSRSYSQTQTPEQVPDSRGRRSFYQQHRSVYQSPRRQLSPAPAYFSNSPMASLQKNSRPHRESAGNLSSTPTSSPLLVASDLPIASTMQKSINHNSSISTWDSSISERHSSLESNILAPSSSSKAPLSPLLVSTSVSTKQVNPSIRDYEIIKPISKGAFGSVYLTRRRLTGEYFAIKVLKKSDMIAKNQVPNVKAERAIMMRQADSPYVAQLYSSFQSKEYLFLVMEYLNGGDTASLLKMLGTLSYEWAKRYIAEVIVGVDDLHKKGIVHRDLKPDNLLIDNHGHLKLTDFGLSRMGLIGRQRNVAHDAVSGSGTLLDALQQNPGTPRHHNRTASITPFSLSPNLERASLSIPSKNNQDLSAAAAASPNSPPQANFFEHLLKNEGRRSSSNTSSNDSPIIRPLIPRTNSQTSFAIDDLDGAPSPNDSISSRTNNPFALFDPQTSTQARKFVGTPDYLAPETIEGLGQDEVSDWWSLGCILFEFLFGYPPFHASTPEKVFENILNAEIDWPNLANEESWTPEAKDLISKLLVKEPSKRLGFNGTEEIKSHPYFEEIDWDTLFEEEASFIPINEDPESTDYFDSRGAEAIDFPNEEHSIEDDDEDTDYDNDITDTLDFSNATKISSPELLDVNRSFGAVNLLGIPTMDRERRRSSKLSENNSNEFGSFQFRNLAALDRANKDAINRLKSEHMDHRGSFSGSSSSTESGQPRSRGYSASGSQFKPVTSPSLLGTPSRGSFSINNPTLYKLSTSNTGSNSGEETSSTPLNESSGRDSPLQSTIQSRSTDAGSPIPKMLKQSARSPIVQPIGQQQGSPQYPAFKALSQSFQDFSPSSSDNEESRNSAILRVRKRRSSRRLDSASSDNSDARAPLISYDVLLCEPIPILRESTKIMLQSLGCAVVAIKDGDELIRRATGAIKFDLIATALRTPKVNAVDVVKLIRNTSTVNSDTPIITITAFYKEAKSSGVFDYVLEKPINKKILKDVLEGLSIQKRKTTQEAISDTEGLP